MGPSVTNAILWFLNDGVLAEEVNLMTIVLIPKNQEPARHEEFPAYIFV